MEPWIPTFIGQFLAWARSHWSAPETPTPARLEVPLTLLTILEEERTAAETKLTAQQTELEELRRQYAQEVAQLTAANEELAKDLTAYRSSLETLRERQSELEEECRQLRNDEEKFLKIREAWKKYLINKPWWKRRWRAIRHLIEVIEQENAIPIEPDEASAIQEAQDQIAREMREETPVKIGWRNHLPSIIGRLRPKNPEQPSP